MLSLAASPKRLALGLICLGLVLGGTLFGGSAALAAITGGRVQVFASPGNNGRGKILIVGAIADHGSTLSINAKGKSDPNGHYVKIMLTKGTFVVNAVALSVKVGHVNPTLFNASTCSVALSASAPVTLSKGTGSYQGISGTVNITESFAVIFPRFASGKHKGKCNASNNSVPVAQRGTISGPGTVSFS